MNIPTVYPVEILLKKFPDLVVINPHMNLYLDESENFFNFLKKNITKKIEKFSIDECFLDLTNFSKKFSSKKNMALFIQNEIKKNLNLPISIGISYNKILAKLATNYAKPFGIKIFEKEDLANEISGLDISSINGIGKKYLIKLNNNSIFKIKDFIIFCKNNKKLDKNLFNICNNFISKGDDKIIEEEKNPKIISRQYTLEYEENQNKEKLLSILKLLTLDISNKMQKKLMASNTFFLNLLFFDNEETSKKIKFSTNIRDFDFFYNKVSILFEEIWNKKNIKRITVGFLNLTSLNNQKDLFDLNNDSDKISNIIKLINIKLKNKSLTTLKDLKNVKNKNKL